MKRLPSPMNARNTWSVARALPPQLPKQQLHRTLYWIPYSLTGTQQPSIVDMANTTSEEPQPVHPEDSTKDIELSEGKTKLRKWLNMNFRIEMTDGRVLIGVFLCTDRDANVILGACSEYLKNSGGETEEPRVLGLVMVPGRHIVSIQIDDTSPPQKYYYEE